MDKRHGKNGGNACGPTFQWKMARKRGKAKEMVHSPWDRCGQLATVFGAVSLNDGERDVYVDRLLWLFDRKGPVKVQQLKIAVLANLYP